MQILTRSGAFEPFDPDRVDAFYRALYAEHGVERYPVTMLVNRVEELLQSMDGQPATSDVQDAIEYALLTYGELELAHTIIRRRLLADIQREQAL